MFFGAALICGGFGWLPLSIAFLLAALATVLLRCITIERVYESIEWRLLILIAGMTAFGTAMEKTGSATLLGQWVVAALEPLGTIGVLAGFLSSRSCSHSRCRMPPLKLPRFDGQGERSLRKTETRA